MRLQEAARFLMGKRHLIAIGAEACDLHRHFFAVLSDALPHLPLLRTQARYSPTVALPMFIEAAPLSDLPVYAVVFVPDDIAGRIAFALAVLATAGAPELAKIIAGPTAPIVMLDAGLKGKRARRLIRDYGLILNTLEALAKGKGAAVYAN